MRHDHDRVVKKGPHPYFLNWKDSASTALRKQCERQGAAHFAAMHERDVATCLRRIETYETTGEISSR